MRAALLSLPVMHAQALAAPAAAGGVASAVFAAANRNGGPLLAPVLPAAANGDARRLSM